ncbi:hypothetical protein D3C83_110150 [compost metagenome]
MKLNVFDFRVRDVEVRPVYNIGEKSGIRIWKVMFTIPMLLVRLFVYRLIQKHIVRVARRPGAGARRVARFRPSAAEMP